MKKEVEISYSDSIYRQMIIAHSIKCPSCDQVNKVVGAGHLHCVGCGIKFKWVEK